MQEIITYLIITTTIAYIIYRMVMAFMPKKAMTGCSPSSCAGCSCSAKKGKIAMSLVAIFLFSSVSFAQAPEIEDKKIDKEEAFEFGTAVTGDFASNFSGGIEQESAYLGNIDITATFSTEKAKLWKGGTFFAYFLNNHGKSISQYVGDMQGVDNIEADAHSRLYQLWYMQEFGDLSITIGQHDLNSEFCASEYGGSFIHSSFGIQPDISANIPVSIFPVATLGAIFKLKVTNNITLLGAVYDGDPGDQETNPNSVDFHWEQSEGTISIVELQKLKEKDGVFNHSIKIGGWSHNIDNHYGIYAILDQKIWSEGADKNQGLGAFTQLGMSPDSHSFLSHYVSFGIHYTGLIKGRDEDNLGIAIGNAFISDDFKNKIIEENLSNETMIELTYKAKLNDNFSVQPDLQYIVYPGGTPSIDNAFVGILRLVAEF
jgi:porin